MAEFVDTSVLIRLLTGDDPAKAASSLALFQGARHGEADLVTSETVIAEVVFVLTSPVTYQNPRPVVADALRPVLTNPGLRVEHKTSIMRALDHWQRTTLDFADCLSAEHVLRQQLAGIYSYDRDFDRIPGLRRLEP